MSIQMILIKFIIYSIYKIRRGAYIILLHQNNLNKKIRITFTN